MTRAGLAVLLAAAARAQSPFIEQLRKAEARSARDPERVEFATRALRAWTPSDGRALRAHAHFARAEGEIERLDDAAAEEDLTKTLESDPGNERAKLLRARARLGLGLGEGAERDAADYLADRPSDGEAWLTLAEARLAQGAPRAGAAARAAFAKAAALLGDDDPRPSLGEGRSYLAMRRFSDALTALSAAAGRPQGRRAEILSERARAYAALGDWSAAREDLTRALPGIERRAEERRRAGASARAQAAASAQAADVYFRRGLAHEALSLDEAAIADHRQACALGLPAACARAGSLEKPAPRSAPAAPKTKKPARRGNPKSGSGERIYAN